MDTNKQILSRPDYVLRIARGNTLTSARGGIMNRYSVGNYSFFYFFFKQIHFKFKSLRCYYKVTNWVSTWLRTTLLDDLYRDQHVTYAPFIDTTNYELLSTVECWYMQIKLTKKTFPHRWIKLIIFCKFVYF